MASMKSAPLLAAALVAAALNAHAMPGMQGQAQAPVTGTVLEAIEVEAYTYLRVKTPGGEIWSAVPKAQVKKGSAVTLVPQTVMENFESKALKRKFDRIVFASLADPKAATSGNPHARTVVAAARIAKVPKATGADARTVEEVVAGGKALKDKTVTIRAQVVKVTNGVMGKNWVHLQDGTGSPAKGTHDILVTTTDAIAVGDVVDARGTVRTDVTIGPGYAYEVMVEAARLRKS
jgi:hypothetical protein